MVTRVGVVALTHQSCINLRPVVVSECGSEEWVWQLGHIRGVSVSHSVVFGYIALVVSDIGHKSGCGSCDHHRCGSVLALVVVSECPWS